MEALESFIKQLERVIGRWPASATWKIHQIAMYTHTDLDTLTEFVSGYKGEEITKHTAINRDEGLELLEYCKKKKGEGISAVSLDQQKEQASALRKAEAILSRVEQLKKENKSKEAIQTYHYLIGEVKDSYPDTKIVANWYVNVADLIFSTQGDAKEGVQNYIKAMHLYYSKNMFDVIQQLYQEVSQVMPEDLSQYFHGEIKQRFTSREFETYFGRDSVK